MILKTETAFHGPFTTALTKLQYCDFYENKNSTDFFEVIWSIYKILFTVFFFTD